MASAADTPYRPDFFPHAQPSARDLPRPTFGKPQDVRGTVKHVRTVAWSCDGRRIATGGEYKEVLVWEAKSSIDAKASISLPSSSKPSPHNGHVGAIAWSPVDPHVVVSGDKGSSAGGVVAMWNVAAPSAPITTFKITGDILHIAFHPSGRHFAVVCPQRNRDEVYFFHLTEVDGEERWQRREDVMLGGASADIGSEEINSLRYINSGKLVCAVSNDGSVNAWRYPLEVQAAEASEPVGHPIIVEPVVPESGPSTTPSSPKVAADDEALLLGKSRPASPREGTPAAETGAKDIEGDDVDMAEEGKNEGEAVEGEAERGDKPDQETSEEKVEPPVESQDALGANGGATEQAGEEAVEVKQDPSAADADGDVQMDATPAVESASTPLPASSAPPSRRPSPPPPVEQKTSGPTKERAEKRKPKQLQRFRHTVCHSASLLSLAFDPQGRFMAVGGQDALLSMYDTREWIVQRTFDTCTAAIRHIAFSYDGEFIAFGGDDTFIAIVSVFTGATVAKLPVHGMVNAIVWHPTKNWLAYSYSGKTSVPLWHIAYQES